MNMNLSRPLVLVVVALCVLALAPAVEARTLTDSRGVPIVSDPRDLSLVPLKPLSDYLYADLKNKGDFGPIRRLALDYKARQVGVPNPRKTELYLGTVISKGPSGNSSAVVVMLGDLKEKDLRATVEKDYREYMAQMQSQPQVSEEELAGVTVTRFTFAERPYDVCLATVPAPRKALLWASIPRGDTSVLEDTIKVVKGEEKLNDAIPSEVEARTTFTLTGREIENLHRFNKPKGQLRETFAKGMKKVSASLGFPQDEKQVMPLEEKIRHVVARSEFVDLRYRWDVDRNKAAAYQMRYTVAMKSPEEAEQLRTLVAEQMVRMGERSTRDDEHDVLGRVTVNADGKDVTLDFTLDTPEAQYQHISFLVSQLFRYRNVMGFLDRHGQAAP